jgi:hypothetical protein
MALRLRQEKSTDGIRSLTELSKQSTNVMYAFIILIVISGLFLGFQGSWWGRGWIWAAIALLTVTIGVMSVMGRRYNAAPSASLYGLADARRPHYRCHQPSFLASCPRLVRDPSQRWVSLPWHCFCG